MYQQELRNGEPVGKPQPVTRMTDSEPADTRRAAPKSAGGKRWDIGTAPLSRNNLDGVAPLVRILGGVLFLAWSWVSTVFVLGNLVAPIVTAQVGGIGGNYLVGFVFAVGVTLAEWVTQGRFPLVHWAIVLLLDASFTTWQTRAWLVTILAHQDVPYSQNLMIGVWIAALIGGIIAAKFGEKLLLGPRRKGKSNGQRT